MGRQALRGGTLGAWGWGERGRQPGMCGDMWQAAGAQSSGNQDRIGIERSSCVLRVLRNGSACVRQAPAATAMAREWPGGMRQP